MVKRLFTLIVLLGSMLVASATVRGDVNGDGMVDVDDVNAIINITLGNAIPDLFEGGSDLNLDGMVDIDDLNIIINIMLGKIPDNTPETKTYTVNGVSFKMVAVEGGTFTMGASDDDSEAWDDEKPAHQVTLSSYAIGETEVTQALWVAVMGNNPSYCNEYGNSDYNSYHSSFNCGTNLLRPVDSVNWDDCQEFITKLNALTGANFRLPTEAEWEYAARGGNKSQGYKYSGSNFVDDVAWYYINCEQDCTHTVATKFPNELGLYDMSGNVPEWCYDWYGVYSSDAQTNPTGPARGYDRVLRNCGWECLDFCCVVTRRGNGPPSESFYGPGLRLAL